MISIYRDSVEAVTELDLTRTNMDINYRISLCTSLEIMESPHDPKMLQLVLLHFWNKVNV